LRSKAERARCSSSGRALAQKPRLAEIHLHVLRQHAHRAQDPGAVRNQHPIDTQLACDEGGMQRAGATEGDEHEIARIHAALDGDEAHGLGHVRRRYQKHR
jgi:hypothetical protein